MFKIKPRSEINALASLGIHRQAASCERFAARRNKASGSITRTIVGGDSRRRFSARLAVPSATGVASYNTLTASKRAVAIPPVPTT